MSQPFGLSALKIHLGATNVCSLPRFVSAKEKGSREEQWISAYDGCQPCQSAAVVETGGRWPSADPVTRGEGGGCGKTGSERRFGPELLFVELIGWLQAPVLLAALYLNYPQHRLPSSNDSHEIQTNFDPLEVAITQKSHLPLYY